MSDYHDIDGNPCTLRTLCMDSPEWAESRIRLVATELPKIRAELARIRVGIGTSQFHQVSDWLEPLYEAERRLASMVVSDTEPSCPEDPPGRDAALYGPCEDCNGAGRISRVMGCGECLGEGNGLPHEEG